LPLSPVTRGAGTVAMLVIGLLVIIVQLPANPETPHTELQSLVLVATIGIWAFCILEPTVTIWMSARGRPSVEQARLRAISIGYAGLLLVVVVGTIAGSLNNFLSLLLSITALAVVPVLYVAFFPPVWLRRVWRQPEEDQFRHALHDLLLYSPDRATLADRALSWAERLVGGESTFVIDSDGSVLAARGISSADARGVAARSAFLEADGQEDGHAPWRAGSTLVGPLDLRQ